ncbi:hypothetical protein EHQ97_05670 [Leptospira adleri]|nr:hypothetical protein EHQ97_05670 [Leptospira adleri]
MLCHSVCETALRRLKPRANSSARLARSRTANVEKPLSLCAIPLRFYLGLGEIGEKRIARGFAFSLSAQFIAFLGSRNERITAASRGASRLLRNSRLASGTFALSLGLRDVR